ncbi:MAG TPA: PaaI family thioesterase [Desulfomonilaceae bacterium]|nr:PaaI family thioesterase [Desulfomonilaceae bacterium]
MSQHTITEERAAFLKADYERGFITFCKFKAVHADWGRFHSTVDIDEDHRQQDGFIHAGVMATMADHTAGYAAFTTVPENMQILTIEFKINFLRPAFGETLACSSRVIREGRQIIIAESEVFDFRRDKKVQVAKAMITLMAVPRDKLKRGADKASKIVIEQAVQERDPVK